MKLLTLTLLSLCSLSTPARAQSLPPMSASTEASGPTTAAGVAADRPAKVEAHIFPLWHKDDTEITRYYSTERLSAADKIEFLYGVGDQRKSLQAELVSLLFQPGIRLSLTATTTATAGADESVRDGNDAELERLRSGGDFGLRAVYPLASATSRNGQAYLIAAPEANFLLAGIGGAQTVTGVSEWSSNIALEGYAEWRALAEAGHVFVSAGAGYQSMSSAFQAKVGAASRNNWAMRVAIGLNVSQMLKIGLERANQPARTDGLNGLSRWRIIVQLTPK